MLEGKPVIEVIEQRRSCRTFSSQPIEADKLARLDEIIAAAATVAPLADMAPAGMKPAGSADGTQSDGATRSAAAAGSLRFMRVQGDAGDGSSGAIRVGTYGTISGAMHYFIGIMPKADPRMERFGYAFEWIILSAAALGLGTCWLGGFFDRDAISAQVTLAADEFIPIISPFGYPADKLSLADRMLRRSAGSDRRKSWGELFFDRSTDVPLTPGQAGAFRQPLEMVRLAPSASNKQPWRIVRQGGRFDFYLQRTRGYGLIMYDIQRNDIGIAQCHFELSARELGMQGHWAGLPEQSAESRRKLPGDYEYIASWIIEP